MHITFLCIFLLTVAFSWGSLHAWLEMSKSSEQSSTLWIIPLISAFLIYERRRAVFANTQFAPFALVLLSLGIGIYAASFSTRLSLARFDATVLAILGVLVSVAGAFVACYGKEAWREASFPLGFLLFAVPIPQAILEHLVRWLQCGSAAVVNLLFVLLDVPHLRDGLRFYLAGLNIEIAAECSGIRSSFALLVLTVLLSYISLHTAWRRFLLVISVVPLVLVKNGIRIVTLSLLTMYVDRSFISGSLHRHGGFVFFGLALAAERALCWLLQRSELRTETSSH
jgi:exosortase